MATTMHGITSETNVTVGPVLTSPVTVNGIKTEALIDTRSPATIMSFKLALEVLKQSQGKYASLCEWQTAATDRLEPPRMTLKSYAGSELNLIGQLQVQLTTISHVVDAIVQVQKFSSSPLTGDGLTPCLGIFINLLQCHRDNQ